MFLAPNFIPLRFKAKSLCSLFVNLTNASPDGRPFADTHKTIPPLKGEQKSNTQFDDVIKCFTAEYKQGQKCETVTLLFIYSNEPFEYIIDQYGGVILL